MLNTLVEDLILKTSLLSHVEIMITDEEKVIYYIGNADNCNRYIFREISEKFKELIKSNLEEPLIFAKHQAFKVVENFKPFKADYICKVEIGEPTNTYMAVKKSKGVLSCWDIFVINSAAYLMSRREEILKEYFIG